MPFAHRLYHYALAHSGWRSADVVKGGESFQALSAGLQRALWRLVGDRKSTARTAFGGVQKPLRSVTARVDKPVPGVVRTLWDAPFSQQSRRVARKRRHCVASRFAQDSAAPQALLLRGSNDFDDRSTSETFIEIVAQRMNAPVEKRLVVERVALRPLPARRTAKFEELLARVRRYGIFAVKAEQYSASSRVIFYRLNVRVYADRVECFLSGQPVFKCHERFAAMGIERGKPAILARLFAADLDRAPRSLEALRCRRKRDSDR